MEPSYYIHVRNGEHDSREYAVVGPYQTEHEAVRAAEFAQLPHWRIEARPYGVGPPRLF